MARFVYAAHDTEGKRIAGSIESATKGDALQTLSDKYALVTFLEPVKDRASTGLFAGSVSQEEVMGMTLQLTSLLEAGIGLKGAMDVLMVDTHNPTLRQVVVDVNTDMSAGSSLSASMNKFPRVFGKFYIGMVEAGE